jgi:hypothetical protein
MSNRDKVNEEMSLVESAAKCGRPEVLSAAMERLLLSPQFTGRVCVVVQDGRVLRQEISAESILAGTTVVAMGSGVSSRTREAKQKARQRSESKPDKEMLAQRLMRGLKLPVSPIVNEFDGDADSGNLAVPASGETKPEGGADSGTGGGGKPSAGSVLPRNEGPMPKRVGAVS